MVQLHNGILCSREKEGAYTLCNSMDGTGEHYSLLLFKNLLLLVISKFLVQLD